MPHLHPTGNSLTPASTPLPAHVGGQNWVYRKELESRRPRAPGAQPPTVWDQPRAKVERLCLPRGPSLRSKWPSSTSWTLNSCACPAYKPLLSTLPQDWSQKDPSLVTAACWARHTPHSSHPDSQLRVWTRWLIWSLSTFPSPLHLFSLTCFGLLNMDILPIMPEAPEPRLLF